MCAYIVLYVLQRADLEAGKKPDKVLGAQAHKRSVAALQKQIAAQEKRLEEVSECSDHLTQGPSCVSHCGVYYRQ